MLFRSVIARYKRMRGFQVMHPRGWDAFGLPAENVAMKHGTHPAAWTQDNIAYMRGQLRAIGLSYDWRRELATCEPDVKPLCHSGCSIRQKRWPRLKLKSNRQ